MVSLELEARLDNLLVTAQAETANIDLFAPIPEKEVCPICMIPLPIEMDETRFMTCCGNVICCGCDMKHMMSEITLKNMKKEGVENGVKCLRCCQEAPKNKVKALKRLMKKNNPLAFFIMAIRHKNGEGVFQNDAAKYNAGDVVFQSDTKALEMFICAAELGHAESSCNIGTYYQNGILVWRKICQKHWNFMKYLQRKDQ